ncbi:MAG: hypothetical protein FD168_2377 [Desulfobulbaceae bacterium]|jgi:hypothetical protein|nr:MAG: hypothetical protein FD168_2377 [Desulfobulbaceae bacterium]
MEKSFFEKPRNIKCIRITLYSICFLLFLADGKIQHHADFPWENWFGFFSIFGFVGCVGLVLGAKYILRPLLKREENYYE